MAAELKLFVKLIGIASAALAAWEMKGRIKERNRKLDGELLDGFMETLSVSDRDGVRELRKATVQIESGYFKLAVTRRIADGEVETMIEETLPSREALERFLSDRTSFRLGDFVRTRPPSQGPL